LGVLPADRIVVPRMPDGPKIGPVQDGYVLNEPLAQTFARGAHHDVPALLGFTRDEAFGGLGPINDLADYQAKAAARYGLLATEFLALYPAATDAEAHAQARLAASPRQHHSLTRATALG